MSELDIEDVTPLSYPEVKQTPKHRKCYNCKHRSGAFKIADKTHFHCFHPEEEKNRGFDTLRNWYDKCGKHELANI